MIEKERRGEYLGHTVQVVPHITDEIKASILSLATPDVNIVITELGGTVGDIEGLPFLEAIRQIPLDVGKENVMFIHLTLVPYLKAAREAKTKPTQHSVQQLREIGIQPDILIVRTERPIGRERTDKSADSSVTLKRKPLSKKSIKSFRFTKCLSDSSNTVLTN